MGLSTLENWIDGSGDSGYPMNIGFYTQSYGPWSTQIRGGMW